MPDAGWNSTGRSAPEFDIYIRHSASVPGDCPPELSRGTIPSHDPRHIGSMSSVDIAAFLESPCGLVADVKMLDFFRRMGTTAAVVIGVLLLVSVVVKNAWCRYLCPYGALMGLVALVSPTRIRRNPTCVSTARCVRRPAQPPCRSTAWPASDPRSAPRACCV